MRAVGAIAAVNLRRYARDRSNLFFALVFPLALILIIGLQFGDDRSPRLGVTTTDTPFTEDLVAEIRALDDDVEIVRFADHDVAVDQVESGDLDAAIEVPDELGRGLHEDPVEIPMVAGTSDAGQQLTTTVDGALARAVAVPTAERAAIDRGADPDAAEAAAARLSSVLDRVEVETVTAGDRLFPEGTGGYDVAAPSTLVLFVFVNGLTGSYALIQTREYGVSRRMLSTPTSSRSIISGEALGRLAISGFQGLYILVATLVLFGVAWGDLLGAAAVLVALAAVSAGAAMCFGTFFSNPDQASGIGVVAALVLGALGGAMLPIELFSDTLADVARFTPHFWAIDAFADLVRHDAGVVDIGPQLGVLVAFAAVLVLLAGWRMRVVLTRPS